LSAGDVFQHNACLRAGCFAGCFSGIPGINAVCDKVSFDGSGAVPYGRITMDPQKNKSAPGNVHCTSALRATAGVFPLLENSH
jgi:hypothetical protein